MGGRESLCESRDRAVDEGLCAFCGQPCETAELMDEIHLAIERLHDVKPGDEGFAEALDAVLGYVG